MTSMGAALAAKDKPKPMRKLVNEFRTRRENAGTLKDDTPGADEHRIILRSSLQRCCTAHNHGSEKDTTSSSQAVRNIRSERISSQRTDILTKYLVLVSKDKEAW